MPVASGKRRRDSARGGKPKSTGVQAVRGSDGATKPLKRPSSFEDLFGGGIGGNLLHPDYDRTEVYAWFQKRHLKGRHLIDDDGFYRHGDHEWKVPYGVRVALNTSLVYAQIVVKYPFYATWVSPKTGNRLKKNFTSLVTAIHFCATKAQYVDPNCAVAAKVAGYDIPPKLRGKLPTKMRGGKMHYWCPYCMDARRFRRAEGEFYALKKFWNNEKERWDWKEVKLAIIRCTYCGVSNQDQKFRRSNQPYEVRKIKKGVRRVRKTKRRR